MNINNVTTTQEICSERDIESSEKECNKDGSANKNESNFDSHEIPGCPRCAEYISLPVRYYWVSNENKPDKGENQNGTRSYQFTGRKRRRKEETLHSYLEWLK